jgi:signal transduction histidine kinase
MDIPSIAPGDVTILIVDDTLINLEIATAFLEHRGYRVVVARNGDEGIERAGLVRPDLILLDVMMPGPDGFETCRRLNAGERTRDIPVILMTALTDTAKKLAGFAVGAVDYVTKPLDGAEMLARIQCHLAISTLRRNLTERNLLMEREIAARTEAQAELQRSREMVRMLGVHNARSLEEERMRVSRELHDEMGQQLAALRMEVSVLRQRTRAGEPPDDPAFDMLLERVDGLVASMRGVVAQLRPTALDGGLAAAIDWLAAEFTRHTNLPCTLEVDGSAPLPKADAATMVFRIAQESLNNVRRHARATRVRLRLRLEDTGCELTVVDDGVGFDVREQSSGYGLLGMEERARALGGVLAVESAPGKGTTVRLQIQSTAQATPWEPE